ncbi:helix-turn-helix domain-containing protein [Archangium sp.]|uniref:TetR/AcrR family transcriptional regulator n=1 Tax=Archangium sp. TaxID=1872627 RepID=UPI002D354A24|nr:helix-turn-helix domain-containing protein [Archangium sp.]HYO56331.1 helix-turn-helix domain-containing protein [Archangium sp.]
MARPRFDKLDPARRKAILEVAAEEFAEHGFEGASYNRILERAGFSKGVAYYYFEGKEDLYATVLELTLEGLLGQVAEWTPPRDAEDFWSQLRRTYVTLLDFLMSDERSGRLLHGMSQARMNPKLQGAWLRFEAPLMGWLQRVLADGRKVAAVRTDVPEGLLLAAMMGMGQATDFWLLEQWERHGERGLRRGAEQAFSLFMDLAADRPRA